MSDPIKMLQDVCLYLIEHGQINEGTPQAALLFEAAEALGALPFEEGETSDL